MTAEVEDDVYERYCLLMDKHRTNTISKNEAVELSNIVTNAFETNAYPDGECYIPDDVFEYAWEIQE